MWNKGKRNQGKWDKWNQGKRNQGKWKQSKWNQVK